MAGRRKGRWYMRMLLVSLVILALSCSKEETSIVPVLNEHLQTYPDMQTEDIYKLLHQAAMGNAHFVDTAVSTQYLYEEASGLTPDSTEPLLERLSPDGNVVRLNLRPYLARGGNLDTLLAAMLTSSRQIRPDPDVLTDWCDELIEEAAYGTIPQDVGTLRVFFKEQRERGYPAVHHSQVYDSLYHPAYRVLLRSQVPGLQ